MRHIRPNGPHRPQRLLDLGRRVLDLGGGRRLKGVAIDAASTSSVGCDTTHGRKEQRMTHSIQEVARLTGVTSRTLRHYDDIGLVRPSATGAGGIRHYDADALVRLQRVLLLRDLGLGLPAIAE